MTRISAALIVLLAVVVLQHGCKEAVTCGAGTHLDGTICVPDDEVQADDAGVPDAQRDGGAADATTDVDASADAGDIADAGEGPLLRVGDPCVGEPGNPDNFVPTCQNGDVFTCVGFPNPQHLSVTYECARYGAECHPGGTDGLHDAHCWGGVAYRECEGPATPNECYDDVTLLVCNGTQFIPHECDPGERCALLEGQSQPFCVEDDGDD